MKKLSVSAEYGVKTDWNKLDEWQKKAHPYTVTIKYDRRQMTIPFFMGSAHTNEPTENDVMPCLASDYWAYQNCRDFEEFASDFGYDSDSRKAESIYNQVVKQSVKLEKLFGNDLDSILNKYQDM